MTNLVNNLTTNLEIHYKEITKDFKSYQGSDPGWGTAARRALFRAACKYLGINPTQTDNIIGVGVHSILQSNYVELTGNILENVKQDPALLQKQASLVEEIRRRREYKVTLIDGKVSFPTQLGGQRARGAMWKQALGFWRWTNEYSATWEMAFNQLTWTVRSVMINCSYVVETNGKITLNYDFSDKLDLRPDWKNRSMEYNAICTVLGFLYHDLLGGSDELKIKGKWKTEIN
jgi:hypothetical protein